MIKKLILAAVLLGTPVFGQEIKLVNINFQEEIGRESYPTRPFNPIMIYQAGATYNGIYIIEVEGQKYIVNAAGGIVKHEVKENK